MQQVVTVEFPVPLREDVHSIGDLDHEPRAPFSS